MTKIDPNMFIPEKQSSRVAKHNDGLGKDDFLKILIAQLQNQDPLNPMDDKEFIAQMAQFSSLEQMMSMNNAMQSILNMQLSGSLVQQSQLIGKKITWLKIVDIDQYRQDVEYVENVVTAVKLDLNGQLQIQLDDGTWISPDQIYQVEEANVDSGEQNEDTEDDNTVENDQVEE